MAYDWNTIADAGSAELRFYRLLGEMLQREAAPDDLHRLRAFLALEQPGIDVWHSLGEALFHTTRGAQSGYRLWTAWARATSVDCYDEGQMLSAWQRLGLDGSESLEETSDGKPLAAALEDPPTLQLDELDDFDDIDDLLACTNVSREEFVAPPITSVMADAAPRLLSYLPSGPHTIRILGEVYDDVDEFTLLALLRRGVFLGLEVLFGGRWLRVEEHPGFEGLIRSMHDEVRRVLASQRCVAPENTHPGA